MVPVEDNENKNLGSSDNAQPPQDKTEIGGFAPQPNAQQPPQSGGQTPPQPWEPQGAPAPQPWQQQPGGPPQQPWQPQGVPAPQPWQQQPGGPPQQPWQPQGAPAPQPWQQQPGGPPQQPWQPQGAPPPQQPGVPPQQPWQPQGTPPQQPAPGQQSQPVPPQQPTEPASAQPPGGPEPTQQPVEPKPAEPTPAEPKPAEVAPAEPKPAEPAPVEPKPAEPTPAEPKPAESSPFAPKDLEQAKPAGDKEATPASAAPQQPAMTGWAPQQESGQQASGGQSGGWQPPASSGPQSESGKKPESGGSGKKSPALIIGIVVGAIAVIGLIIWGAFALLDGDDKKADEPEPTPTEEATDVIEPGTYTVGEDIAAGKYYLEPLDTMGSIEITEKDSSWITGSDWFYRTIYVEFKDGDEVVLEDAKGYPFDQRPEPNKEEIQGSYLIGEDLDAGLYVVLPDESGSWVEGDIASDMRWSSDSRVIAGLSGVEYGVIEVEDGDYLHIDRGTAVPIAEAPEADPTVDGIYRVGEEVPAGYYRVLPVDPNTNISITTYKSTRTTDIVYNEYADDQLYVDLQDGDYVKLYNASLEDPEAEVDIDLNDFSGMVEVGREIEAGEYQVQAGEEYFSLRILGTDGMRVWSDYEYLSIDNMAYVSVEEGQYLWISRGAIVPIADATVQTVLENTMLKVGLDIDPGTYILSPIDDYSSYEIFSDATLSWESSKKFESIDADIEVTLEEGDYIVLDGASLAPAS